MLTIFNELSSGRVMFGFFKKRTEQKKLTEARRLGQQFGTAFGTQIKAFLGASFEELEESYVNIAGQRAAAAVKVWPAGIKASEVMAAMGQEFYEECEELPDTIMEKAQRSLGEMFDVAEQVGMRPELDEIMREDIAAWIPKLKDKVLEVIILEVWPHLSEEEIKELSPPS